MHQRIVRENRIRRAAQRRGMRVSKSSRKDKKAPDYNRFMVTDLLTGKIELGNDPHPFSAKIEDVEAFLGIAGKDKPLSARGDGR